MRSERLSGTALCVALVASMGLAAGARAAADGAEVRSIVIDREAPQVVRFAAEELQQHWEKICGRKIPIVSADEAQPGPRVLLGRSRLTEDVPFDAKALFPEGFLIRRRGDDLVVIGEDRDVGANAFLPFDPQRSHKGTLFGVCTLLERFYGVRWFWPGASGEILPAQDEIRLPEDVAIREKPAFLWRHHFLCGSAELKKPEVREVWLWYMRTRLGVGIGTPYSFAHSWSSRLGGNRHFDEHPEYYSFVEGERRAFHVNSKGRAEAKGRQVCTSNPGTVRVFLASLRKSPEDVFDIVAMSPNDGGGFCECRTCTALDRPELYGPEDGYQSTVYSDRAFAFVNQLARQVRQTHPGRNLGIFAYTFLRTPPRALARVESNIVVSFTQQLSLYNDPDLKKTYRAQLHAWLSKGNKLVQRDYLGLYNFGSIFIPQSAMIAEDVRTGAQHAPQVIGFYSETGCGDLVMNHLNYLVLARLLWEPSVSVEDVVDDYCRNCYGQAHEEMREFYRVLEHAFVTRPAGQPLYFVGVDRWLSEALVRQSLDLLKRAGARAADPAARQRIAVVERCFTYSIKARDFVRRGKQLTDKGLPIRFRGYEPHDAAPVSSRKEICDLIDGVVAAYKELLLWIEKLEQAPDLIFAADSFRRMDKTYRWGATLAQYRELFMRPGQAVLVLPDVWRFRIDPDQVGEASGWHGRGFADADWAEIRIDEAWERQGYGEREFGRKDGYNGCAWYRLKAVRIPPAHRGKPCRLQLGAVDEDCWVYVNGKLAGTHIYDPDKDPDAWKKPQEFDLTPDILAEGDNTIAVRVRDSSGAGGIWRKAYLVFPDADPANGRCVFQEGFESEEWRERVGLNRGEYALTLDPDAAEGERALRVDVQGPLPNQCAVTWPTIPVVGGKIYAFELAYRLRHVRENAGERRNWKRRPQAPTVRFISRDARDKVCVEVGDYVWVGGPFRESTDGWAALRKVFRAPQTASKLGLTVFLNAQGEYWLDGLKLIER